MSKTYNLVFRDGSFLLSRKHACKAISIDVLCVDWATSDANGRFSRLYLLVATAGETFGSFLVRKQNGDPRARKALRIGSLERVRTWSESREAIWDIVFAFQRTFVGDGETFQVELTEGECCERLSKDLAEQFAHLDRDIVHGPSGECGV